MMCAHPDAARGSRRVGPLWRRQTVRGWHASVIERDLESPLIVYAFHTGAQLHPTEGAARAEAWRTARTLAEAQP